MTNNLTIPLTVILISWPVIIFSQTVDYALSFDGSNDYIQVPHHPSLNLSDSFTIAAWIYIREYEEWASFVTKGGQVGNTRTAGNNYTIHQSGPAGGSDFGYLRFTGTDLPYNLESETKISLNEWNFVAVTYDGDTLRFYLNGEPDGKGELPGPLVVPQEEDPLYIGVDPPGLDEYWNGMIGELRIWNKILSLDNIRMAMCGLNDIHNGLVGYWAIDQGSGNIAYDESSKENHGTFMGDPQWIKLTPSPCLAIKPEAGRHLEVKFEINGTNFTPDGEIYRFVKHPNEEYQRISTITADDEGEVYWTYTPDCNHPVGDTYIYALDVLTNKESNEILKRVYNNSKCEIIWPALDKYGNENRNITQDYSAYLFYPSFNINGFHTGIDIGSFPDKDDRTTNVIRVIENGTIHDIKYDPDPWGNAVIIKHDGGIYSLYAHLAYFFDGIDKGKDVYKGQELGIMGSTGQSTGSHLHFEIKNNSSWGPGYTSDLPDGYNYIDPRIFMYPFIEESIIPFNIKVISGNRVNVRSGPGTDYAISTQIENEQIYTVFMQSDGWYKLYLPNANGLVTGWVHGDLVNGNVITEYVKVDNTGEHGLKIRKSPGQNSEEVKNKYTNVNLKFWDSQIIAINNVEEINGVKWYSIDLPTIADQHYGWISGDWVVTAVKERITEISSQFTLYQNYPNPFNASTIIRYSIPERSHITLTIYNALGQTITTLVNKEQEAGFYEVTFDASHFPSGVYVYRLLAGEYVESRKMLYLK